MEPYDHLISILDAFIEEFDGGMRIRGIKTVLLIHRASIDGHGISISEIARETKAPLENIRRHINRQVELGNLRYVSDPDDERVTRVLATDSSRWRSAAENIEYRLAEIEAAHRRSHRSDT